MVVIVLPIVLPRSTQLLCQPEIVTRGFVYVKESERAAAGAAGHCPERRWTASLSAASAAGRTRARSAKPCASAVSSYLFKHTKRSPMVIPMVTML